MMGSRHEVLQAQVEQAPGGGDRVLTCYGRRATPSAASRCPTAESCCSVPLCPALSLAVGHGGGESQDHAVPGVWHLKPVQVSRLPITLGIALVGF